MRRLPFRLAVLLPAVIALGVAASGCDTAPGLDATADPEATVLFEGEPGYAEAQAADDRAAGAALPDGIATARQAPRPNFGTVLARAESTPEGRRYRRWVRDLRFPRRLTDRAQGEVAFVSYRLYDADGAVLRLANAAIPGGPAEDEARALLLERLSFDGAVAVAPPETGSGAAVSAAARAEPDAAVGPSAGLSGGEWCGDMETGYVPCDDDAVVVIGERPPSNAPPPYTGGGSGDPWDPNDTCTYDPGHPDCGAGGGPGVITLDPPTGEWPGSDPDSDSDIWPRVVGESVHEWYGNCSNLPSGESQAEKEKRNLAFEASVIEAFGATQDTRSSNSRLGGYKPLDGFTTHNGYITRIFEVKNRTGSAWAIKDDDLLQTLRHINRLAEHREALRRLADGADWVLELGAPTYTVVTTSIHAPGGLDFNGRVLEHARAMGVNLEIYVLRSRGGDWYLDGYRLNAVGWSFNEWYASVPYGEVPEWGRFLIPGHELSNQGFRAKCQSRPSLGGAPDPPQ